MPYSQALSEARKRQGIPTVTVFPCPPGLKSALVEKASNAPVRELITILCVDGFVRHEVKIEVRVLDTYMLLSRALKVHLDPRFNGIPKHTMTKATRVKIGPQFSVKAMQDVQVERGGDSITVVICSQKSGFVFHHVCTEQQPISGL